MAFPTTVFTNDTSASGLINAAANAGLRLSGLEPLSQLQSVVANLLIDEPPGAVSAGDIASGTFGSGIPDTGTYTFPSALVITGALTGVTSATFSTLVVSSTALATPAALAATGFNAFASTVSGAVLMGFGTTFDAALKNRAGTDVIGITANTTGVVLAGALRVNGIASLGTAAGTDQTVIDGTAFGAGVASLRLNGLTTAAVTNQTGTLTNAPVSGNATFWIPVSIAGTIKYIPAW